MPSQYQEFRDEKILSRISELRALGLSEQDIADQINEEFKLKNQATQRIIRGVIRGQTIRHKEFVKTDQDYAAVYKKFLMSVLKDADKNAKVLKDIRKHLIDKLEKIKDEAPGVIISNYIRDISNLIKVHNDTLRTISKHLERFEKQQQEVKTNQVVYAKEVINQIKSLKEKGVIQINPDYQEMFEEGR